MDNSVPQHNAADAIVRLVCPILETYPYQMMDGFSSFFTSSQACPVKVHRPLFHHVIHFYSCFISVNNFNYDIVLKDCFKPHKPLCFEILHEVETSQKN